MNVHLIPGIGRHRLAKLEPEHLEKLYARMIANGSKPATAHQVHRTIRTALNEALRRRHLTTVNPATIAKAPTLGDEEVEPYLIDEVKRLLVTAAERRNAARWAIALALGLRQGEALGLKWTDVDLDAGLLTVRRARQRPRYSHGCGDTCGHPRAGHCPQRIPLREDTAETKSRAGRRTIGLPDELVAVLRRHRALQAAERIKAGQLWVDGGWLFASPTGEPVNPRTDYTEWKRLLKDTGLRDSRLHDARHTAATVLLLLGVSERAVMGLMGWSNTAMAARYQHMTGAVQRDVADRLGLLLWGNETRRGSSEAIETTIETRHQTPGDPGRVARRLCWSAGGGGGI